MQSGKTLRVFIGIVIMGLALAGALEGKPDSAFRGFLQLQITPARLITDFTMVMGVGATLMNVAAVGALGLLFLRLTGLYPTGASTAALFTMMGFAFFGKTVLNCLPFMAGVALSALLVGKKPRDYALIAMFGTAMGPLVSFLAFELGVPAAWALPGSILIGVVIGIIMPPIAIEMLRLHQGYCLYNTGLSVGFIGLFTASISHAAGANMSPLLAWRTEPSLLMYAIVPAIALIALGCIALETRDDQYSLQRLYREYRSILRLNGRLPSDFCDLVSVPAALLNAALLSLMYVVIMLLIGAPFNGPVLGGLFTIIGFSFFGKHARNVLAILAGIFIAILVFGKSLQAPVVILAILFSSALAPLAGEFGPVVGIVAGFLHLVMVERTGGWHGGFDLYNNGFAGGLTATLIISILDWYRSNRKLQ